MRPKLYYIYLLSSLSSTRESTLLDVCSTVIFFTYFSIIFGCFFFLLHDRDFGKNALQPNIHIYIYENKK